MILTQLSMAFSTAPCKFRSLDCGAATHNKPSVLLKNIPLYPQIKPFNPPKKTMRPSPRIFLQPLFGAFRTIVPAFLATAIVPLFAQGLTPTMSVRGDGKAVAKFTNVGTGTWTVPAGVTEVEVLVVGGGGGNDVWSGGAGAGGMYFNSSYSVTPGTPMTVTVGGGGVGLNYDKGGLANSGQLSQFGTQLIAYGGNGGADYSTANGGNQGGYSTDGGSTIVPGQAPAEPRAWGWWSGSGAGAPGTQGGAVGGIGAPCSITGTEVYYAGGGGKNENGAGGQGGGGHGSYTFGGVADPGAPNTGGGAGGSWGGNPGANGGSGVVIVAYTSAATFYTVSFDSTGGTAVANKSVESGTTTTAPTPPTKAGYTFVEWCTDNTLTAAYDFATPVSGNMTLYAKWATNWVVTFDSNGGSAVATQSVSPGATATLPTAPTRTGYTFAGWYADSGLSTVFNFGTAITADTTIYANWSINSYTLNYTAGTNGSISGDSPQTVQFGGSGTTVTAVPAPGYQFVQWSDNSRVNPRTDSNVGGNINVTASFELIPPPITPDSISLRGDGKTVAVFSTVGKGTWTIPAGVTSMEVLVVGGGGGGGQQSSGAGAGGMYQTKSYTVTAGQTVHIEVGAGGLGGNGPAGYNYYPGTNGALSQFGQLLAFGGQLGGSYSTGGNQGGYSTNNGATIIPGYAGGGGVPGHYGAGAGAGAVGGNLNGSAGGIGAICDITGTNTYYAGGGGSNGSGPGGLGGGGIGATSPAESTPAGSGVNGLGGGGGGGWGDAAGGAGGSGVVIVAYTISASATAVELDSDVNPSTEGSSVTFTATVKDGAATATSATGTIEFKVDDVVVEAAAAIVNGVATYTTSSLSVGERSVTATYSGDSTYGGSFASMTQTVNAAPANPYEEWAGVSGYNLTGGPGDDDDGDGVSNYHEFAFGLDPTSAASSNPIVDLSLLKTEGNFSYTRHSTSNLTYTVLASTDLQQWDPVGFSEYPGAPDEATGVVTVVVNLDDPPTQSKFFVRVQASEAPAPQ